MHPISHEGCVCIFFGVAFPRAIALLDEIDAHELIVVVATSRISCLPDIHMSIDKFRSRMNVRVYLYENVTSIVFSAVSAGIVILDKHEENGFYEYFFERVVIENILGLQEQNEYYFVVLNSTRSSTSVNLKYLKARLEKRALATEADDTTTLRIEPLLPTKTSHRSDVVQVTHVQAEMERSLSAAPMYPLTSLHLTHNVVRPTCIVEIDPLSRFEPIVPAGHWYRESFYRAPPFVISAAHDVDVFGFAALAVVLDGGDRVLVDRHAYEMLIETNIIERTSANAGEDARIGACPYPEVLNTHAERFMEMFYNRSVAYFEDTESFIVHHRWINHYGHFVHELLPQFLFWRENYRAQGVKLYSQLSRAWHRELLTLAGINPEEVCELASFAGTHFRKVHFSNSLQDQNYRFCPEMVMASELAREIWKQPSWRMIYASRLDTPHRTIINELDIVNSLSGLGFEIIEGSKLSVAAQIERFAQARVIVGAHGANLTNLVFCRPGTIFVELLNTSFYDPFYMRLANLSDLYYEQHIMNVSNPGADPRSTESVCDINGLLKQLQQFTSK